MRSQDHVEAASSIRVSGGFLSNRIRSSSEVRSFYPQDYRDTHALSHVLDYRETHALSHIQDFQEEPMLSPVYEITGMTHALSCTRDYRDHPFPLS